eukprot:3535206-Rhodomonas_salina.2
MRPMTGLASARSGPSRLEARFADGFRARRAGSASEKAGRRESGRGETRVGMRSSEPSHAHSEKVSSASGRSDLGMHRLGEQKQS